MQPIDPADTDLVAFREAVFAAAEARCDELADAFAGNPNSVNKCYEILDASSPIWTKGESEVCPVAEGFNAPPPDHWSSYYRLAAMIGQNSVGTYEIDQAFYEDILANPWWLAQDSMYIALDANSDFAFFNVDSSDLVYALGIRSGDVPLTVNGHDVTSMAGALAAYAALWSESDFELVLARPTGPVTLHYTLVP